MVRKSKSTKALTFQVKNIRGLTEVQFDLKPGLNLFTGRNGAGKTTSINAAIGAIAGPEAARKLPLTVRDGARSGYVQGPGVFLSVGRSITADGAPAIELADTSRFSDLVRPRFATLEARNKARLEALLAFRPLAVDEEALLSLCRGDLTVAAAVQGKRPDWEAISVLELAEAVRSVANACGLDQEKVAAEKAGAITLLQRKLDTLGDLSSPPTESSRDLAAAIDGAVEQVSRMRIEASAREQLLAQQQEVRASLGERPNLDDLDWQLGEAAEHVEYLETRLRALQEELLGARSMLAERQAARTAGARAAEQWDHSQEVLSRLVTGPTGEEVQAAEDALACLRRLHEDAVAAEDAGQVRDELQAAQRARETAKSVAKDYRDIAIAVPGEIARLLSERDLDGITIEDGQLTVILPSGELRDFEDLSFGEQVRAACRIALTSYRKSDLPVVASLAADFWGALDFEHRKELAEIAAAEGIYLLAEEPTRGDLDVQHVDQGNAAELLGVEG